jgi:hypothetical protein
MSYVGTIINRLPRGKLLKSKGDFLDRVFSDQTILRSVRREAGPRERFPKALKIKLSQGGPSGSSLLRSDGSCDGQASGWTKLMAAKGMQGKSWKTTLRATRPNQNRHRDSLKKCHLTLSQGMLKKGDDVAVDDDDDAVKLHVSRS